MPASSPAQHRLMEAAAHTPGGYDGVPQAVGKEFVKADAADGTKYETELDVARAIMRGELESPQFYENSWFYAIRISGTGISYRPSLKEYVWRSPDVFLSDEFKARCAGLPVILVHPEKSLLNAEEYQNRNVGSVMLPYVSEDELWAIARIFDGEVVTAMQDGTLSTSPGVRFDPVEEIATVALDGDRLTVEGNPKLIDHIAIVPSGVWDKGGAPSGIRNDSQDPAYDLAAAQAQSSASQESGAERPPTANTTKETAMADGKSDEDVGARADVAKDLMDKLDALCSRMDAIGARVDAFEAKPEAEDKKDSEKDEDKDEDKKDADEDKAEKDRADAAAAQNAALQAQIAAMEARLSAVLVAPSYEDMDKLSAAQNRADGVLQMLGERTEKPFAGESSISYRKRILAKLKKHSATLKDISIDALDGVVLDQIEGAIYADASAVARNPAQHRPGVLTPVMTRDNAGRNITKYYGDSKVWRDAFSAKPIVVAMERPHGGLN